MKFLKYNRENHSGCSLYTGLLLYGSHRPAWPSWVRYCPYQSEISLALIRPAEDIGHRCDISDCAQNPCSWCPAAWVGGGFCYTLPPLSPPAHPCPPAAAAAWGGTSPSWQRWHACSGRYPAVVLDMLGLEGDFLLASVQAAAAWSNTSRCWWPGRLLQL